MDEFEQREGEAAAAQSHRLDARVRQERTARASADKMHSTAAKTGNDKVSQRTTSISSPPSTPCPSTVDLGEGWRVMTRDKSSGWGIL
jgi:hypothetical protein